MLHLLFLQKIYYYLPNGICAPVHNVFFIWFLHVKFLFHSSEECFGNFLVQCLKALDLSVDTLWCTFQKIFVLPLPNWVIETSGNTCMIFSFLGLEWHVIGGSIVTVDITQLLSAEACWLWWFISQMSESYNLLLNISV